MQLTRTYFARRFDQWVSKERLSEASLLEVVVRLESGLFDADLGGNVYKVRVARLGRGRSSGYRSIIVFRSGDRAVFVYGYAKNDKANLTNRELIGYREMAAELLTYTEEQLDALTDAGVLRLIEEKGENEHQ
ncbi:MAG TPA: type II toxin-antitoxin system RelE/ParE family toxin [Fimbriimonas sp.]|nr:type II toxin-antitoxin system RelE/ParE family toxin [Fimbriimonas sp.]